MIYIHKKLISIAAFLLLLISSCNMAQQRQKEVDVHIGFNGLNMEFLKGTPPKNTFEGEKFPVLIKAENKGAYGINSPEKSYLSIGVEKDYTKDVQLLAGGNVGLLQLGLAKIAEFSIEGRSQINLRGGEEVISYSIEAGRIDPQSERHQSAVIATLCYPYKTTLETTACIDTDANNLRPGKKACSSQDMIFGNGQGAPLAVTKIEARMLPTQQDKIKPQFLIFVEDKSNGLVIKKESVKEFCTISGTSHENFNIVYVKAFLSFYHFS